MWKYEIIFFVLESSYYHGKINLLNLLNFAHYFKSFYFLTLPIQILFGKIQKFPKFTLSQVRKKKQERLKMINQARWDNDLSEWVGEWKKWVRVSERPWKIWDIYLSEKQRETKQIKQFFHFDLK